MHSRYISLTVAAVIGSAASSSIMGAGTRPDGASDRQISTQVRGAQTALDGILAELRARSTPAQYDVFATAIQTSPQLAAQLKKLTKEGLLKQITIEQSSGPAWGAWRDGARWTFTPEYVATLAPHRIFDVVQEGEIMPSNMAFALGYMAWHTQHREEREKLEQEAHNSASSASTDQTTERNRWIDRRLGMEARAFIQGWNNVMDAATAQNRGAPLSPTQIGALALNLVFREPFMQESRAELAERAADAQSASNVPALQQSPLPASRYHLDLGPAGIPMDMANIEAMKNALKPSRMIGIAP